MNDGINARYIRIAKDVFNGGYTPDEPGCDVTLKRYKQTFAWYGKDGVLDFESQITLFKKYGIDKSAVYNALRKITL
ncbi:MAG TPA: hypothetical protein VJ485_03030 [archaeon]|nr:hypothetical protein [archaeon]